MYIETPTKDQVIEILKNNKDKEVFVRFLYYQYKGTVKRFATLAEIEADAGDCQYYKNKIQRKWEATTNINTAKKYKEFLSISY